MTEAPPPTVVARARPALRLPAWVDDLDLALDRAWEPLRGVPAVDKIFYGASAAADFSVLWHGLNLLRLVRGRADRTDLVRVAVAIGLESVIVNQGLKRLFVRDRPDASAMLRPHRLRQPSTSSFPSGHASSAVVAAALLGEHDPWRPLYCAVAVVVATSRLHVRIHHGSDVLAGMATGVVLWRAFRRVWPHSMD